MSDSKYLTDFDKHSRETDIGPLATIRPASDALPLPFMKPYYVPVAWPSSATATVLGITCQPVRVDQARPAKRLEVKPQ